MVESDQKKVILFVDEDEATLNAIKSVFIRMTEALDLHFTTTAREALGMIERLDPEVAFVGLNLRDGNGVDLLARISDRRPDTVRVFMSDHPNDQSTYNSFEIGHQFIAKPIDKNRVKLVLFEALSFRELMNDEQVISVVNSMKRIPSLPKLYHQIMRLLWSPDSTIDQIASLIAKDMGMTSNILRLANSAFYAPGKSVDNIDDAVHMLGLKTIKTLVLMIHIFDETEERILDRLHLRGLWDHSFTVARYAEFIAKNEGMGSHFKEICSTAGLLHSIGRLILATNYPDQYAKVQEKLAVSNNDSTVSELERAIIGVDHCEVGAYLLGIWGIPHPITNVVLHHNTPSKTLCDTLSPLVVVHVANVLAHEQEDDCSAPFVKLDGKIVGDLSLADKIDVWRDKIIEFDANHVDIEHSVA